MRPRRRFKFLKRLCSGVTMMVAARVPRPQHQLSDSESTAKPDSEAAGFKLCSNLNLSLKLTVN
jgi:hypothetical protein